MTWKERSLLAFVVLSIVLVGATVGEGLMSSNVVQTGVQKPVTGLEAPSATPTAVHPTHTPAPTPLLQPTSTPQQGIEDLA